MVEAVVIPEKLHYLVRKGATVPEDTSEVVFFNTDDAFHYQPFFNDFGPLNLSHLITYCRILDKRFAAEPRRVHCHWTGADPGRRANACYLLGSYLIIRRGLTADEAFAPFRRVAPTLKPFRDAALGPVTFPLRLHDVLRAVYRAFRDGLMGDVDSFDCGKYEHYERVENGDLNWIVPGKIVGFAGPAATRPPGEQLPFVVEDYVPLFRGWGVSTVVRLNKRVYDARRFVREGIAHSDIIFPDGASPSLSAVKKFLAVVENAPGAVAVHCKAGLGRTGTMICCYLIRKYRWTAIEAIAWCRICRPGSHTILGMGTLSPQLAMMNTEDPGDLDEEGEEEVVVDGEEEEAAETSSKPPKAAPAESPQHLPASATVAASASGNTAEAAVAAKGHVATTPAHHYNLRPRPVAVVPSGTSLQKKKLEQQHMHMHDGDHHHQEADVLTEATAAASGRRILPHAAERPSSAPHNDPATDRHSMRSLGGSGPVAMLMRSAAGQGRQQRRMSVTLPVGCVGTSIVHTHPHGKAQQSKSKGKGKQPAVVVVEDL